MKVLNESGVNAYYVVLMQMLNTSGVNTDIECLILILSSGEDLISCYKLCKLAH